MHTKCIHIAQHTPLYYIVGVNVSLAKYFSIICMCWLRQMLLPSMNEKTFLFQGWVHWVEHKNSIWDCSKQNLIRVSLRKLHLHNGQKSHKWLRKSISLQDCQRTFAMMILAKLDHFEGFKSIKKAGLRWDSNPWSFGPKLKSHMLYQRGHGDLITKLSSIESKNLVQIFNF